MSLLKYYVLKHLSTSHTYGSFLNKILFPAYPCIFLKSNIFLSNLFLPLLVAHLHFLQMSQRNSSYAISFLPRNQFFLKMFPAILKPNLQLSISPNHIVFVSHKFLYQYPNTTESNFYLLTSAIHIVHSEFFE